MPDFGRNSRGDDPSLDAIVNSDRFLDALAAGQQVAPQDQGDAMLAELLGGWRDEMRWPPATGLITERDAVAALRTGLAEKQHSGRSRRGLSIVGAAAAGVLVFGGFGAVVYGAGPGDALYGLHTMLFGEPQKVREDKVTLASAAEQLKQVQQLVEQGDWPAAQAKLVEVNNQVAGVDDAPLKQQVLEQWNELSAKVVQQDPEATVPPGITYTVPPSATELVPAVITPTGGPEVPPPSCRSAGCDSPITISTTPDGTGTFGPSPSDTPTPSTEPTEPTTTVDPTTTAQVPTTTTSAAPETTTTTVPPTTTTVAPTTTTTVAPTTTTTTTTTLAAAATTTSASAAAQAPAVATTSAPAAAAESPAAPATSAPTTASIATATQQPIISIPSTVIQAPKTQPPAAVITTTMVMPMPQLPKQPSSGGGVSGGSSDEN
jgi:hypothetical protein